MLLTKEVEVRWNGHNRKHYESLGYIYPYKCEKFIVPIEHLADGSTTKVKVKCDICGKIMDRCWKDYLKHHDAEFGDTCQKCNNIKRKRTLNNEYGVDNVSQLQEVKDKKIETCNENFGVNHPFQSKEVQYKSQETCLEKYGVRFAMQSDIIKEESKQRCLEKYGVESTNQLQEVKDKKMETCIERYGVEYPFQSDEIQKKIRQKFLENYGVEYPFQSDEIQNKSKQTRLECYGNENYNNREQARATTFEHYGVENPSQIEGFGDRVKQTCLERYGDECYRNVEKAWETKRRNGSFNSSKPEQYLYGLLCGYYGSENVEWQKRVGKYSLDCELVINGIKIDVEYNGWYWHAERDGAKEHDAERREYLLSENYKQLNIISDRCNNNIEDIKQIINAIDTLVFTNTNVLNIELHTHTIDNQQPSPE